MNCIILSGRLTKKPELRTTQSGKSVCAFSLAVDRDFKNGDGEYGTDFVECVSFGITAENLANYQDKGGMIELKGRLEVNEYTDNEGKNRHKTNVAVDSIKYINKPKTNAYEAKNDQKDPYLEMSSKVNEEYDLPF